MNRNPSFLKQKYNNLHTSPEVVEAAERAETTAKARNKELREEGKSGPLAREKVPVDPTERIQNYLDQLSEVATYPEAERQDKMNRIKQSLYKAYVIDSQAATDQHIALQKTIAKEQNRDDVNISTQTQKDIEKAVKLLLTGKDAVTVLSNFPNEQKQTVEEIVAIVEDQKGSCDQWVDYLASPDAAYPDWLKYWTLRNILQLGKYDKEKKFFPERTKNNTSPFPDLDHEALANVLDAIHKKTGNKEPNLENIPATKREEFTKLLAGENFAKLYAFAVENITTAGAELLEITDGKWVKYPQGTNAIPLVRSLQGHGTGWCTAGEMVAQSQLSRGDFHVYYSLDEHGKPNIPRAAIRMEGDKIVEVRGIAARQEMDQYIESVVHTKMAEFPEGNVYMKKADDVKRLNSLYKKTFKIDKKTNAKTLLNPTLSRSDLVFLYETENTIESFGYDRHPRIAELLKSRDPKADAPIVFDCAPSEIAYNPTEITPNTKVYIGPFFLDILKHLDHIQYFYKNFPEGSNLRPTIEIDYQKTPQEYIAELEKQGFEVSEYAKYLLEHMRDQAQDVAEQSFATIKNFLGIGKSKKETKQTEQIDLIRLTVKDLGFTQGATIDQIYAQAEKLGLELCPPEVGPEYRLKYTNQPTGEWLRIAMKQISGPDGRPDVFRLGHGGDGVWLHNRWAEPAGKWLPGDGFVFRLPSSRK